jgi:hypothetical protein
MKMYKILSASLVLVLVSACGSQTAKTTSSSASTASNPISSTSGTVSNYSGTNISNLPQAPQQTLQVSGVNGPAPIQALTFGTSATLKVKITALQAPNLTVANGWTFPYGCMQISVSVNGVTQTTQVLRVANQAQGSTSPCANAADHQVLDFSNAMTGSGNVTITFSAPQYDNCRYYWPLNYGCQMSAVWQNHEVKFNAAVQYDGTWMDP